MVDMVQRDTANHTGVDMSALASNMSARRNEPAS